MHIGEILYGFSVEGTFTHPDIGGRLWKLRHEKTGAPLLWLDNGEENKLFSISFKTLPWDDSGVFHILEHSVLCGSESFPVKEPFLDLLKGSMNTFLNAMTFNDKTMYPVSSRNEQDFLNLMHVYLDAVFCPAIYQNPHIFAQEGWHYDLHEGESAPTYKGVVFNEMKGAFSSVDTVVEEEILHLLFPDNCYRFCSGGHPSAIPTLSRQEFLSAHEKFYHPSNAYIYLDGDMALSRVLPLIDAYLSRYEKRELALDIPMQKKRPPLSHTAYYEIGKEEKEKDKTHLAYGNLLCPWHDKKTAAAAFLLSSYLTSSNASPLKKAILDKGLSGDLSLYICEGIAETYSVLHLRNTEKKNEAAILSTIDEVVDRLSAEGFDEEELQACLNQFEFSLRETEEPRGLNRAINVMSSWLYGGAPEEGLLYSDLLTSLRAEIGTPYFGALLRRLFDRSHMVSLTVLPAKTAGEEARAAEEERIKEATALWSEEDWRTCLSATAALEAWQTSEDSEEARATLPRLSLSDIGPCPKNSETIVSHRGEATFLFHPQPSGRVTHLRYYFSLNDCGIDDLPRLSFLTSLFGELPTKERSAAELQKQIKKSIGYLNFTISAYPLMGETDRCRLFFVVSMGLLQENLAPATALLAEILTKTDFSDRAAVQSSLHQDLDDLYESIMERGHRYGTVRAGRNLAAAALAEEQLDGYTTYRALSAFADNYEEEAPAFCRLAEDFCQSTFCPARLTVSETAEEAHEALWAILPLLHQNEVKALPAYFAPPLSGEAVKEALLIPSSVSFASLCGNLYRLGADYTGAFGVLSGILSYGYLWNEIRVRGGAYGCGFGCATTGNLYFRSFRDPTPLRSLSIYRETEAFLRAFVESGEEIDNYIISTLASADPLRSPRQRGGVADMDFFAERSYADRARQWNEVLTLKPADLLSLCPLFSALSLTGSVCLVGHEGALSDLPADFTRLKL